MTLSGNLTHLKGLKFFEKENYKPNKCLKLCFSRVRQCSLVAKINFPFSSIKLNNRYIDFEKNGSRFLGVNHEVLSLAKPYLTY